MGRSIRRAWLQLLPSLMHAGLPDIAYLGISETRVLCINKNYLDNFCFSGCGEFFFFFFWPSPNGSRFGNLGSCVADAFMGKPLRH